MQFIERCILRPCKKWQPVNVREHPVNGALT